jgi:hypothetical protein
LPTWLEIHRFIVQNGIEEARRQALTKHERQVIEAAYQVLSDDAEKIGFTYSGFAPDLPAPQATSRSHLAPGRLQPHHAHPKRRRPPGEPLGLPFGSYARFILLFLQSDAIRTASREVVLGRSMRVWLGSMGLSIGGKTYRQVNDQARRISGCTLTFYADRKGTELMRRGGFVDGAINMADAIDDQPSLWQERVLLNEE